MPPRAPRIDRDRFLALALAMAAPAAQACSKTPASGDPAVAGPLEIPIVSVTPAPPPPPPAPPPSSAPVVFTPPDPPTPQTTACEQDNDTGDVDCTRFKVPKAGPACEGVAEVCELLKKHHGYRAHAAQRAAECMEKLGARVCDIKARDKCFEQAAKQSCAEPKFEAECDASLKACAAAKVRPSYTKEECVRVLSSLHGGDLKWASKAMGPSSEGKCRLMYPVF